MGSPGGPRGGWACLCVVAAESTLVRTHRLSFCYGEESILIYLILSKKKNKNKKTNSRGMDGECQPVGFAPHPCLDSLAPMNVHDHNTTHPRSNISSLCACWLLSHFSCVQPFVTLRTLALWAPLSMGFSRQEYWSGLPCLLQGDLLDPGIELISPAAPASAGGFFSTEHKIYVISYYLLFSENNKHIEIKNRSNHLARACCGAFQKLTTWWEMDL